MYDICAEIAVVFAFTRNQRKYDKNKRETNKK